MDHFNHQMVNNVMMATKSMEMDAQACLIETGWACTTFR